MRQSVLRFELGVPNQDQKTHFFANYSIRFLSDALRM